MEQTALQGQLGEPSGWSNVDGMLRKTYTFQNFTEAVGWTVRVAFLAEAHAHHPDIDIRYNRVTLALVTHDAGNQITEKDIALAKAIEAM